jgi:hypothetical protein
MTVQWGRSAILLRLWRGRGMVGFPSAAGFIVTLPSPRPWTGLDTPADRSHRCGRIGRVEVS